MVENTKTNRESWFHTTYHILQIAPCTGYLGVFAMECGGSDGDDGDDGDDVATDKTDTTDTTERKTDTTENSVLSVAKGQTEQTEQTDRTDRTEKTDQQFELVAWKIDGFALVEATTIETEGIPGKPSTFRRFDRETITEMVGIEFINGYCHICDEASNFAGICREGEDIYESTGCLEGRFLTGLQPKPAAKVSSINRRDI